MKMTIECLCQLQYEVTCMVPFLGKSREHDGRMQPIRGARNPTAPKNPVGFDNPSLVGGDSIDFDDRSRAEVFVTGSSQHSKLK